MDSSADLAGNFTPSAQEVLRLAHEEAERLRHNFVGTEHVLLGLLRLGKGTAVAILSKSGIHLDGLRAEIEKHTATGPEKIIGFAAYTPRVKKVLALAAKEARALNHTYVGTEHILLGLLREGDGVAGRVLLNLGLKLEKVRHEILAELDPNLTPASVEATSDSASKITMPPKARQDEFIDTSKRYDVYCTERQGTMVVYRNARFKGVRDLLSRNGYDPFSEFLELEQADGQTVFVARFSVVRFCEHGGKPASE